MDKMATQMSNSDLRGTNQPLILSKGNPKGETLKGMERNTAKGVKASVSIQDVTTISYGHGDSAPAFDVWGDD